MKVSLVVSPYLQKNSIFREGLHRDDIFHRFRLLKEMLEDQGHQIATDDLFPKESSDRILYAANMPSTLPRQNEVSKSFIILSESEFIKPENYIRSKHAFFNKVFTWHDDFVDGDKYIKLNYAHPFNNDVPEDPKRKLCTLIAANKKATRMKASDLYRERVNAIRWFEKNHPEDFDLYGVGWDNFRFNGFSGASVLNKISGRLKPLFRMANKTFPSYAGIIDSKFDVLKKYKFSICYENAKGIPGYITEKIFDSFNAGCVPVYYGAPNVADYIPENCFLDFNKFESYQHLYEYMKSVSEEEYLGMVKNIKEYLASDCSYQFSSLGFCEIIIRGMKL